MGRVGKFSNILEGCLHLILSPSPSEKIQIMGEKIAVVARIKKEGRVVAEKKDGCHLIFGVYFPPTIWISTEGEDDGIKFRQPSKRDGTLLWQGQFGSGLLCGWPFLKPRERADGGRLENARSRIILPHCGNKRLDGCFSLHPLHYSLSKNAENTSSFLQV